jgi:hypothetical protein
MRRSTLDRKHLIWYLEKAMLRRCKSFFLFFFLHIISVLT